MLDPRLQEKLAQGYSNLGRIAHKIALNMRKGKDSTPSQKELYVKASKIRMILKVLFRHVTFDTTPPTLWNITEDQVNTLVRFLDRIGDLERIPAAPSILPTSTPIIVNTGSKGDKGEAGDPGSDANIIVEADSGETQIVVTPEVIADVTHYKLKLVTYSAPQLQVSINGTKIYEKGVTVASLEIDFISTKGSKNVTSITITDPSSLNSTLQGVLDLLTVNGVSQPVTTFITDSNITDTKNYIAQISDGININSDMDTVSFFYPFFYGATSGTSINVYSDLTKLVQGQSNKTVNLNGTNKYFWFAYLASYGSLARIRDQNGFVVTDAFTVSTVSVTSVGLDNNWTVSYKVYRTTLPTNIGNQPYTFEF